MQIIVNINFYGIIVHTRALLLELILPALTLAPQLLAQFLSLCICPLSRRRLLLTLFLQRRLRILGHAFHKSVP